MKKPGPPLTPDVRTIVRFPSWLGDLVMAEPTVRAVYDVYARAGVPERLSLAAPFHLLPVLDGAFPGARRMAQPGRRGDHPAAWRGHDVALLLSNSFRTAWTAWRARIPRRVGWARDGRGLFLTESMRAPREGGGIPLGCGVRGRWPRPLPRPFGASCIEIAGLLGVFVADTRPRLPVVDEVREDARARLAAGGIDPDAPFAVANVGSRPNSAKGYPPAQWSATLEAFCAESRLPLVLVGGPGEEAAVRAVDTPASTLALIDPVVNLRELSALFSLARIVLTPDSGPRHVAQAVGTPTAVVMGPSDPRHTADHLDRTSILREEVPCGPCHQETCPLTGADHHQCMQRIAPERFARAALDLLSRETPC